SEGRGMSRILIPLAILAALIATACAALPLETGAPAREPPLEHARKSVREMAAAVARVFGDRVVVETASGGGVITADLNGDGAEDLAIVVKPIESALPEINHPLASWRVVDP